MKILPLLSTLAAAACLALSVWLVVASGTNEALQDRLREKQDNLDSRQQEIETRQRQLAVQQDQINLASQLASQVGPGVVRDLAALVLETDNGEVRALLEKHGIRVNEEAAAPAGAVLDASPTGPVTRPTAAPPSPAIPVPAPPTPSAPAVSPTAPTLPNR